MSSKSEPMDTKNYFRQDLLRFSVIASVFIIILIVLIYIENTTNYFETWIEALMSTTGISL